MGQGRPSRSRRHRTRERYKLNSDMRPTFRLVNPSVQTPEVPARGKPKIRVNLWGNWNAYRGSTKVKEFGEREDEAKEWLAAQETPKLDSK